MAEMRTYDPFDELKRIHSRIDSLFDGQFPAKGKNIDMPGVDIPRLDIDIVVTVDMPGVDILHQGNDIVVTVDMPDVDKDDIDLGIRENRVLDILAQRKSEETLKENAGSLPIERQYIYYCRSIMLPAPVNKMESKVIYENGVLALTLPLKRKAAEKKSEVQTV